MCRAQHIITVMHYSFLFFLALFVLELCQNNKNLLTPVEVSHKLHVSLIEYKQKLVKKKKKTNCRKQGLHV